jgi:hypothetical protein
MQVCDQIRQHKTHFRVIRSRAQLGVHAMQGCRQLRRRALRIVGRVVELIVS